MVVFDIVIDVLQLISDVLNIAHSIAQRTILSGLLVKPWEDKSDLFVSDQMVDQRKDVVVDIQHVIKSLLLLLDRMLELSQYATPGINEVIREEILPIEQDDGLG